MKDESLDRALADGRTSDALQILVEQFQFGVRSGDIGRMRRLAALTGDPIPVALAWRLGYALYTVGQLDEAVDIFARADADGDVCDQSALHGVLAAALWSQGDAARSRELADQALREAEECGDDGVLASAWVAQALAFGLEGDRTANRRAYLRALPAAERSGNAFLEVRIHSNMSALDIDIGDYDSALEHLDIAVDLAAANGYTSLEMLVLCNRVGALLALGRLDEAISEAEAAKAIGTSADLAHLSLAWLGIGEANRMSGNASRAAAAYREAIAVAERYSSQQALLPALAGLAMTTIVDDPTEARQAAKRALDQPAANGYVTALLALGWVELCEDRPMEAFELATAAGLEAGRRDDPRGLAGSLELRALCGLGDSADLAAEAATVWEATGNPIGRATNAALRARLRGDRIAETTARAQLRSLGVRDSASRVAGPLMVLGRTARTSLRVRALGSFAVFVGDQPLTASDWGSRKPREILKILIGRPGQSVPREILAETLWPGTPGASRRLSVALSTLRSVLDPAREFPSEQYVAADRQTVWLAVDNMDLDVAQFRHWAQAGLQAAAAGLPGAIEALMQAASAYTGEFLEEDPYSQWAADTRDELLGLALDVRRELAAQLIASDQPLKAVAWLVSMLADDPFDEPTHRELMRILHAAGRHGEVRRRYRNYLQRMTEIGAPNVSLATILRN